ncbi:transposase [Candidatus Megaera polyxenophila]|nr:transposase [Candidatus Megaera polyxenophila]
MVKVRNGNIEIDNNAAERALRAVAIGRKNWLFAGSDKGGNTAAMSYCQMLCMKKIRQHIFSHLSYRY